MENGNGNLPVYDAAANPSAAPAAPESFELSSRERPVGLPSLEYNILHYKTKLFLAVGLLVTESSLLPIALFYGLWYGTTLRHGILFAIITAFYGLVTGIEFGLRSLRLIMKADTYRPLGGGRWAFDFTHHTLAFGYFYMTAILIGASIPHEPLVRPLAMVVPLFFLQASLQLIVTGWLSQAGRPAPFRVSSVPKGATYPPMILTIIEDIVGVDGAGGKEYRKRLMARYAASPMFRDMIARLNWFWGFGGLFCGIGTIFAICLPPQEVAYGLGWGIPLLWVITWTAITVYWVRRRLRLEKKMWTVGDSSSADMPAGLP